MSKPYGVVSVDLFVSHASFLSMRNVLWRSAQMCPKRSSSTTLVVVRFDQFIMLLATRSSFVDDISLKSWVMQSNLSWNGTFIWCRTLEMSLFKH